MPFKVVAGQGDKPVVEVTRFWRHQAVHSRGDKRHDPFKIEGDRRELSGTKVSNQTGHMKGLCTMVDKPS